MGVTTKVEPLPQPVSDTDQGALDDTKKNLQNGASTLTTGAGEGNRTPVSSLGSLHSTIEPHPHE